MKHLPFDTMDKHDHFPIDISLYLNRSKLNKLNQNCVNMQFSRSITSDGGQPVGIRVLTSLNHVIINLQVSQKLSPQQGTTTALFMIFLQMGQ